jgi:hypothetical protein
MNRKFIKISLLIFYVLLLSQINTQNSSCSNICKNLAHYSCIICYNTCHLSIDSTNNSTNQTYYDTF